MARLRRNESRLFAPEAFDCAFVPVAADCWPASRNRFDRGYLNHLSHHPRYQYDRWLQPFHEAAAEVLRPGVVVLDVGGGRRPALARSQLPAGARYIGLDLSQSELEAAPPGSYDEAIEGDITEHNPALRSSVDLAVSWQVLEHVAPMRLALANVHSYLRPGGRLVAQVSGGHALFALLNRAIPHRLAAAGMKHLLGRDPKTVFPAQYDDCTHTALTRLLTDWSQVRIVPRFAGATYFGFIRPLQWAYLKAEDSIARRGHPNLATHYLIIADR